MLHALIHVEIVQAGAHGVLCVLQLGRHRRARLALKNQSRDAVIAVVVEAVPREIRQRERLRLRRGRRWGPRARGQTPC